MKIQRKKGRTVMIPETKADLVAISRIIRKGDEVSAETTRAIEIDKGDRKEKVRKKFWLSVEAEETGMEHGRLRVKGKVLSELEWVQRFSYHTLDISEGQRVEIGRELLSSEWTFLKRFLGKRRPVIACILDERECEIYRIGEGHESVARISRKGGKMFEQRKDSYFREIMEILKRHYDGRLIIAGPGFAREELARMAEKEGMSFVTEGLAHSGLAGLREVFRRGMVERVDREMRIGEESRLVEEFFSRISRSDRVVYGREGVAQAVRMGAVETLLISDEFLADGIVGEAERMGSRVEIISSSHEEGKRFLEFSGYGAFLRYDVA